jgi:hypothetical protein
MLLTKKASVLKALEKITYDQVDVIHGLAESRGLDVESLDIKDYKELIQEEAEFSFDCGDKSESDLKYSLDLYSIALRIQDPQYKQA